MVPYGFFTASGGGLERRTALAPYLEISLGKKESRLIVSRRDSANNMHSRSPSKSKEATSGAVMCRVFGCSGKTPKTPVKDTGSRLPEDLLIRQRRRLKDTASCTENPDDTQHDTLPDISSSQRTGRQAEQHMSPTR
ncbi:unnamed protein product [Durusdinium trenchii]|uniref:Uncharacterized protein n=1 Tax=Durusdinium trenchii TaxID=1381693 RepID=A0ABP0MGQ6_9DINO